MVDFETFAQNFKKRILGFMPEEYRAARVTLTCVPKNGKEKLGFTIRKENWMTAPLVYLERYYEMFRGGHTEEEVLMQAAQDYQKEGRKIPQSIGKPVQDFEMVKDRLWVELVGRRERRADFKDAVYKEVEGTDLAAIFRIRANFKGFDPNDLVIGDALLKKWGCGLDSLYQAALKNLMCQMPAQITGTGFYGEENFEKVSCGMGEIYMLTNAGQKYGASAFLYPGLLQTLAENSGKGFFILPSSKHEVMLMRADAEVDAKELQRIVIEGNARQNEPEEVLSNQVYCYDADTRSLSCVTTGEETKELLKEFFGWGVSGPSIVPGETDEEMER